MADNTQGNQQGSTNNKTSGLSWSQPPKATTSPLLGSSTAKFSSPTSTSKTTPTPKPMPSNGRGRGRLVVLFLSGAVVGAVLTWGYYTLNPQESVVEATNTATSTNPVGTSGTTPKPTGTTVSTPTAPVIGSMGGITLPNPQPAGLKVEITSAPVTVPTWVVVYDVTNGQRGNALGAGYFTPTTGSRSINLLRATQAGKTYWVGKRVDNGDKDFTSADQPVLNAAGQPLYVEFTAR